jgi:soluble lytic murein transglycosylase-like protein
MRILILVLAAMTAIWFGYGRDESPDMDQPEVSDLPYAREDLDALVEGLLKKEQKAPKKAVPQKRERLAPRTWEINFSDGKFNELSEKWRNGILWLVKTDQCRSYDEVINRVAGGDRMTFLLVKAQMMTESNCRSGAVGGGTDFGLFQVQKPTCRKDVGVEGDLYDPETNIVCAVGYLAVLCEKHKRCTLPELYAAYNAGPTGARSIKDARAFDYVRKIHFVLTRLLAHEKVRTGEGE